MRTVGSLQLHSSLGLSAAVLSAAVLHKLVHPC